MEEKNKKIKEIEELKMEAIRRKLVKITKEKGMAIECIERQRMLPITLSILQRLHDLLTDLKTLGGSIIESYKKLEKFQDLKVNDPATIAVKVQVFENVVEAHRENILALINTYNNIINDIKHHYAKKDKIVEHFRELEMPKESSRLIGVIITMYREIKQMEAYMLRWLVPC